MLTHKSLDPATVDGIEWMSLMFNISAEEIVSRAVTNYQSAVIASGYELPEVAEMKRLAASSS